MIMYKLLRVVRKTCPTEESFIKGEGRQLLSNFVGQPTQPGGLHPTRYFTDKHTKAPRRGLKVGYGLFVYTNLQFAEEEIRNTLHPCELWEVEVLEKDLLPRKIMSSAAYEISRVLYEGFDVEELVDPVEDDVYDNTRTVKKLRLVRKI